jgi:hypothetical protein
VSKDKGVSMTFEDIVANTRGVSHLERIVGIYYDLESDYDCSLAAVTYMNERATGQDLFFPNLFDALAANPDFHIFLANFLEQQPDARVFIGLDLNFASEARYLFDLFVVGKTRLCSDLELPAVDASLMSFNNDFNDFDDYDDDDDDDDDHSDHDHESHQNNTDGSSFNNYDFSDTLVLTQGVTVWEQLGDVIKQNIILEGLEVSTAVLTRMVLDGTTPLLRVLIATHPRVTTALLLGLLEQTDPIEFHLLEVIAQHPLADERVLQLARTLGDD